MTTTRFCEKQAQIHQKRDQMIDRYPALWTKMISEWNTPGSNDTVWLMYSANYLLRTGNVKWAIDPLSLNWRLSDAPKVDLCRDLEDLSLVLLTHSHLDHLDLDLLSVLKDLPIQWVIPAFLIPLIKEQVDLPAERIIIPRSLHSIEFEGMRIMPFDGQHLVDNPDGTTSGVPEMGYLVESANKSWLFLGDTRIFDARRFPAFGPVDTLFAHLWLGRRGTMQEPPQYLDAFCQFCADMQPGRVILSHIEELGRDADDYWDASHVDKILTRFQQKFPAIPIVPIYFGERMVL